MTLKIINNKTARWNKVLSKSRRSHLYRNVEVIGDELSALLVGEVLVAMSDQRDEACGVELHVEQTPHDRILHCLERRRLTSVIHRCRLPGDQCQEVSHGQSTIEQQVEGAFLTDGFRLKNCGKIAAISTEFWV